MLHELGHSLGLSHRRKEEGFYKVSLVPEKYTLSVDDLMGLGALSVPKTTTTKNISFNTVKSSLTDKSYNNNESVNNINDNNNNKFMWC